MSDEHTELIEQTPDKLTGMLCKACNHDLSDHKTSQHAVGYPCVTSGCPCPFFQG